MRRALQAAALCALAFVLAPSAAAEGFAAERPSLAFESTALAYGLAVGTPRLSLAATIPLAKGLSIEASPAAAWEGSDYLEFALPIVLRGAIRLGLLTPFFGAGIEGAWARLDGFEGAAAAGPILELGERFQLFNTGVFLEPYAGGALIFAWGEAAGQLCTPSAFGGLRIGYGFPGPR